MKAGDFLIAPAGRDDSDGWLIVPIVHAGDYEQHIDGTTKIGEYSIPWANHPAIHGRGTAFYRHDMVEFGGQWEVLEMP